MKKRPPKCKKCHVFMIHGKAIQNTLVISEDFPGTGEGCTANYSGPGKLIDVWKCPKCGYSISKGKEE